MNREPFYEQDGVTVFLGDCLDVMRGMTDNCIDSIVTDPPYDLTGKSGKGGFMNKTWDASGIAFNPEVWREALRVAKPGATLMAFGGTRTHHRLACAIEDAGWEIRDCINYLNDGTQAEMAFMASLDEEQLAAYLELHYPNYQISWVYGSGFPKSHNVSKAIDKRAGAEREVIGKHPKPCGVGTNGTQSIGGAWQDAPNITAPASPLAVKFDGYGSALKPVYESVIVARKSNLELTIDTLLGTIIVTNLQILSEVLLCQKRCQLSVRNAEKNLRQLENQVKGILQNIALENVLAFPKESELIVFANSVESHLNYLKVELKEVGFTVPESVKGNGKSNLQVNPILAGEVENLQEVMGISLSMLDAENTGLNTILLWKNTLGEVLNHLNRFTTLMKFEMITELKILNWSLYQSILGSIIHQSEILISGNLSPVSIAEKNLNAVREKLDYTLEHFAQDDAISINHTNYQEEIGHKSPSVAYEPIIVAMKPMAGGFAENAKQWGIAGLNIDGCRVPTNGDYHNAGWGPRYGQSSMPAMGGHQTRPYVQEAIRNGEPVKDSKPHPQGRYPANTIHSTEPGVMAEFAKAGVSVSSGGGMKDLKNGKLFQGGTNPNVTKSSGLGDTGTPARYFAQCPPDEWPRFIYQAKAGKKERGKGNNHPTVKSLELVKYLVRLCRPPDGGVVLDPFAGSGTTALACQAENRRCILIEKEEPYCHIVVNRLNGQTDVTPPQTEARETGPQVKQLSIMDSING